ncbi:uncharacterized protein LOC125740749 isoform X1 [Brienomyrus brachyistius]|uniref:uncharacterized protein LOC125740749 isoform X1 n=1 Tax=Brienomyrus brachyistius TaxID=42636 RepID=UPI0020B33BC0|nr:uncharacterized protein LOC125740749 isoform X1 [Brienomyrus brachyistius]
MAQRMKIPKAVSWINDQHWGAWDLWDEVIDWGERKGLEECSPATPPTVQAGEVMAGLGGVTDWCKGGEGVRVIGNAGIFSETLQENYGLTSEEWEIYKTYYLHKKKKVRKNRTSQGVGEVKGEVSGERVEVAERERHVGKISGVQVEGADQNVGINKMQNGSNGKQGEVGVNVKVVKVEGGNITLKAEDTKGNVKVEALQVRVCEFGLAEVISGDVNFEIVGVEVGEVIIEGVDMVRDVTILEIIVSDVLVDIINRERGNEETGGVEIDVGQVEIEDVEVVEN